MASLREQLCWTRLQRAQLPAARHQMYLSATFSRCAVRPAAQTRCVQESVLRHLRWHRPQNVSHQIRTLQRMYAGQTVQALISRGRSFTAMCGCVVSLVLSIHVWLFPSLAF
eukprot:COSAG02_NODE_1231_length_13766_cov_16.546572_8_plen_112_part_00